MRKEKGRIYILLDQSISYDAHPLIVCKTFPCQRPYKPCIYIKALLLRTYPAKSTFLTLRSKRHGLRGHPYKVLKGEGRRFR